MASYTPNRKSAAKTTTPKPNAEALIAHNKALIGKLIEETKAAALEAHLPFTLAEFGYHTEDEAYNKMYNGEWESSQDCWESSSC
jgi:hypothetical protein